MDEIRGWIRKKLDASYSPEQIKKSLRNSGRYDPRLVDGVLKERSEGEHRPWKYLLISILVIIILLSTFLIYLPGLFKRGQGAAREKAAVKVFLPRTRLYRIILNASKREEVQTPNYLRLELVPRNITESLLRGKASVGLVPAGRYLGTRGMSPPNLKIGCVGIKVRNLGIFTRNGSEISTPQDLEGKKIVTDKNVNLFLQGFLRNEGIERDGIKVQHIPVPRIPSYLLNESAAAGVLYGTHYLNEKKKLKLLADIGEDFKKRYGFYPILFFVIVNEEIPDEQLNETLSVLQKSYQTAMENSEGYIKYWGKQGVDVTSLFELLENKEVTMFERPDREEIRKIREIYSNVTGESVVPLDDLISEITCE